MILIIGACASGKRTYAKSLGYSDADMSSSLTADCPVLYDLQNIVEEDPENALLLAEKLLKKEIVICNEVGSGVIPVSAQKRRGREQTGRLCCVLAKEASSVIRMVAGLPQKIK